MVEVGDEVTDSTSPVAIGVDLEDADFDDAGFDADADADVLLLIVLDDMEVVEIGISELIAVPTVENNAPEERVITGVLAAT